MRHTLSTAILMLATVPSFAEVSVGSCDGPTVHCEFWGSSERTELRFSERSRVEFHASALGKCDRTTHISHAGESDHRDLGAGRVEYVEWWSQEGVYTDMVIARCGRGDFLRTRVREERISKRAHFDVGAKVRKLIDVELTASPALFSLERLADALHGTGRDIEIATVDTEPCACAVAYPELLGSKTPFEEGQ